MCPVEMIEVSSGDPIVPEPNDLHIMQIGLKKPLVEG